MFTLLGTPVNLNIYVVTQPDNHVAALKIHKTMQIQDKGLQLMFTSTPEWEKVFEPDGLV